MQSSNNGDPSLSTLVNEAMPQFIHSAYRNEVEDHHVPFSMYFPANYSAKADYPLVIYVPTKEQIATGALGCVSNFGALIWTTHNDCFVAVPHTLEHLTDLIDWLQGQFPIATVLGVGDSTHSEVSAFAAFLAIGPVGDLDSIPHRIVDAIIDPEARDWLLSNSAA